MTKTEGGMKLRAVKYRQFEKISSVMGNNMQKGFFFGIPGFWYCLLENGMMMNIKVKAMPLRAD